MDISTPTQIKESEQEWYSSALVQNAETIQYYQLKLEEYLEIPTIPESDIEYIRNKIESLFTIRQQLSKKYLNAVLNKK